MKRILSIITAGLIALLSFSSCGGIQYNNKEFNAASIDAYLTGYYAGGFQSETTQGRYDLRGSYLTDRDIEDIFKDLSRYLPETFYEAILCIYLCFSADPDSVGTLDRYLYPFYIKDIENGMLTKEEAAEYPQQFDIQYKNTRVFATYQGEEPLENIQIRLVCQMYDSAEEVALIATENEVKDVEEAWQEAREWSGDTSTEPPEITSGGFSSSSGEGSRYLNGKTVEKGDKILLTGGGGGYDGWLGTEELHFIVWIYYDDECVEVIKK